jgi:hypothetical protein
MLEALRGSNLAPAVQQLLLQKAELSPAHSAAADVGAEEAEIVCVIWAEAAAMPTANEIYFLGLTSVAGTADLSPT